MTDCIAIFDIGKTNKKICLFNRQYVCVYERTEQLPETKDEDGFPTEDLELLERWILQTLDQLFSNADFNIVAVNVAAYGASLVYLDEAGRVIAPLYNYLKPYPSDLLNQFLRLCDPAGMLAKETAAPVTGSLNSGLQVFRIKKEQPALFARVHRVLHLPEYLASLISGCHVSGTGSIGCHTALWDFTKNKYHDWVEQEQLIRLFAPIGSSDNTRFINYQGRSLEVGNGIHDSTAALIPYQLSVAEPFLLISTGSWCVCLNPFDAAPLTDDALAHDCLCYMDYRGMPVKAHRSPAGFRHEEQAGALAIRHQRKSNAYMEIDKDQASRLHLFPAGTYEKDYFELMDQIMAVLSSGIRKVLNHPVRQVLVSGGFSENPVFMHLLHKAFPDLEIMPAEVSQASALGAAMVMGLSGWVSS